MIGLYQLIYVCSALFCVEALQGQAPFIASQTDTLPALLVQQKLRHRDFPDAALQQSGDTLFVAYTRSRYRPGAASTLRILNSLDFSAFPEVRTCRVYVQDDDIPQYYHDIPVAEGHAQVSASTYIIGEAASAPSALRRTSARFANYHLELSVDLLPRFAFGANPDPVQSQLNLLPGLALRLWPGSRLHIQYALPLWNELNIPEEDYVRPRLVTFSQLLRPARGLFLRGTVGYFHGYRYGGQLEVGYLAWRGRLFLGASMGHTGYAAFPQRLNAAEGVRPGWEVSPLGYNDFRGTVGWRWDRYNLQLLASAGKALLNQHVKTLAVNRQFRQTNVSGFVQQIDDQWNYGLGLVLPIPFVRYFAGPRVTLQTGAFLDFHYNGTQNYLSHYHTGHASPILYGNLHPGMIFDNIGNHN